MEQGVSGFSRGKYQHLFQSISVRLQLQSLTVLFCASDACDQEDFAALADWPREGSPLSGELIHALKQHGLAQFAKGEVFSRVSLTALPLFSLNSPSVCGLLVAACRETTQFDAENIHALQSFSEVVLSLERYHARGSSAAMNPLVGPLSRALSTAQIAETVANIYARDFRKKSGIRDQWDTCGRVLFEEKVKMMIELRQPISFVLPAFPCKSRNRTRKTSGTLPDMGEFLALKRLVSLVNAVQDETGHPAHVLVVSDGRVFADLVRVSDDVVSKYSARLRDLGSQFKELSFFGLEDAFGRSTMGHDEARERLMQVYGANEAWVIDRIERDDDFRAVYSGLVQFMTEDFEDVLANVTKSQRRKVASKTAKKMVARNEAYSNLVEDLFPYAVRLSIHPHPNVKKFGINLVQCENLWRTPWHAVAVLRDGQWVLMHKSEALLLGFAEKRSEPDGLIYFG
jgi:pyoverdine/dityrosine biosynthesis protein Dit1